MPTLATPENMRAYARTNPGKHWPDRGATPAPRGCIAYSPVTGAQYSANAGDYWHLADDWVMRDTEGHPMVLVTVETVYRDVTTGEYVCPIRKLMPVACSHAVQAHA